MKKLTTQIIIILTLTLSFVLFAQTIELKIKDTEDATEKTMSLPLEQGSTVEILSNGNVTVSTTTVDFAEQLETIGGFSSGQPPEFTLDFAPNPVNGATSVRVFTNSIEHEAVYCTKTGSWSGDTVFNPPATFLTDVSEDNLGNGDYNLSCTNSFGTTSGGSVHISGITAAPVAPTLTLVVNPVSVDAGGTATLTWTIGKSPTSCTKSGDWSGAMSANDIKNGEHTLPITNITESKTFKLECFNSALTGQSSGLKDATVLINGQDPNVWASCGGNAAYILDGAEDRTIISTNTDVANDYNGKYSEIRATDSNFPWPGSEGINVHLSINKNKYMAAKFTTDSIGYDAELVFSGVNAFQGPAPLAKTIAISTCPGDFSNTTMGGQEKCKSNSSSITWSTKDTPAGPAGFFCKLQKDTTYYLNIVHSNNVQTIGQPDNYATSDCVGSKDYCGMLFQYIKVGF